MTNLSLTMATSDYDHIRDLINGSVKPEGIDLTCLTFDVEEIFFRFANKYEWEISELSLAKFCSLRSVDEPPVVGIPVMVSRMFRHSAFYIRTDGKIKTAKDLKGCRIGVPEWTQTATVYARGWLQNEGGVGLTEVEWVQAGVNEPGRKEMGKAIIPENIKISQVNDRSLSELLIDGEIEAIISARPPQLFVSGDNGIGRLMPNYKELEREYFDRTKIYPIMHIIAIRRDAYEKNRWIAGNLMTAFEIAKQNSLKRLADFNVSRIPIPWVQDNFASIGEQLFHGSDYWPYGIDSNRVTLETFLQYCHEQGVTQKKLQLEDLFVPEVTSSFKI